MSVAAGPVTQSAALAAAERTQRPVELSADTTETLQTFANPSGTLTMRQGAAPERVRRGTGWVPVDTRLSRRADASVRPAVTAVGLVFSGGGSRAPMARLSLDGTSIGLTWPGRLPMPSFAGDTATYPEVLPGVDLLVRAQANGPSDVRKRFRYDAALSVTYTPPPPPPPANSPPKAEVLAGLSEFGLARGDIRSAVIRLHDAEMMLVGLGVGLVWPAIARLRERLRES